MQTGDRVDGKAKVKQISVVGKKVASVYNGSCLLFIIKIFN